MCHIGNSKAFTILTHSRLSNLGAHWPIGAAKPGPLPIFALDFGLQTAQTFWRWARGPPMPPIGAGCPWKNNSWVRNNQNMILYPQKTWKSNLPGVAIPYKRTGFGSSTSTQRVSGAILLHKGLVNLRHISPGLIHQIWARCPSTSRDQEQRGDTTHPLTARKYCLLWCTRRHCLVSATVRLENIESHHIKIPRVAQA